MDDYAYNARGHSQRMICEVVNGVVTADPHGLGDEQGSQGLPA